VIFQWSRDSKRSQIFSATLPHCPVRASTEITSAADDANAGRRNMRMRDLAALNQGGFDIDLIGGDVGWYRIRDEAKRHFLKHDE
jgi:hypothetical protein